MFPQNTTPFPSFLGGTWLHKMDPVKIQLYHGLASQIHRLVMTGFLITLGVAVLSILFVVESQQPSPAHLRSMLIQGILGSLAAAAAGYFYTLRGLNKPLQSIQEVEGRLAEATKTNRFLPLPAEDPDHADSLVEAYNELTKRSQEREVQQLEIHGRVFHNLRSPLASIMGYAGLLSDPSLSQDPEFLKTAQEVVLNQGKYLTRFIENCSTVVSLESSQSNPGAAPFRLDRLLEAIITEFREQTERDLLFENPLGELRVSGDEFDLRTALVQLIDNGLKYSQPDQPVTVRISNANQPGWIDISVEDHGIGIDEIEKDILFSRFGRVRNARNREIHGGGLGLYIAKIIADRYSGNISLKSNPGEGSTFTLQLPVVRL